MKAVTDFDDTKPLLLLSGFMFAIATATLMTLVNQVSGTPYISGGDSPAGTDCSGLASWVSNAATGRPVYGDRFNTGNIEGALKARGFQYGSKPGALVIGWNRGHAAVTLPDGTPVSSGERGGVKIGGGGAYQRQFTKHMYLPIPDAPAPEALPPGVFPPPPPPPGVLPPPEALPAPEAVVVPMALEALPPPVEGQPVPAPPPPPEVAPGPVPIGEPAPPLPPA